MFSHLSGPKWAKEYAMTKTKTDRRSTPVAKDLDPEVRAFRQQFDERSPLDDRAQLSPGVLPALLRRSEAIEEMIPWLYLKGISTCDFGEALQALVGERAKGLSPNVIVRLKDQWSAEYEQWNQRDLSQKHYFAFGLTEVVT